MRVLLLAVASMIGAAGPVLAQPADTGWTASLLAGQLFGGDLDVGERELTAGAAVGRSMGRGFSLEAELAVIPELSQFDAELWVGTGSLLYHPVAIGRRVTPYGLLGASLARITAPRPGPTSLEVALDFGGGVWLRVAGPIALRADVRFIHIDNAPNFWRAAGGVTFAP
jgi:hypothetical protein